MLFYKKLLAMLSLLGILANASPSWPSHGDNCLTDAEALEISTRWLSIFSTGAVTSKSQLATIVSHNIASYDYTFGPPTFGINALWAAVSAPGKYPTTDVKQFPLWLFHSCDQIGLRWQYEAVSTGYESTVPAGTKVAFEGNDLLHIDLGTKLIFNATSSGDWILLSRQLGYNCPV